MRAELERFGGREVKTTGDGMLVTFDGSVRALALRGGDQAQRARARSPLRIGVHVGEVEIVGDDVRGVTVHEAARIMAAAGPDEILVSELTRMLAARSRLRRPRHARAQGTRRRMAPLGVRRGDELEPPEPRPRRMIRSATSPVQPVWWEAPSPAPVSPWKYSWNGIRSCQAGSLLEQVVVAEHRPPAVRRRARKMRDQPAGELVGDLRRASAAAPSRSGTRR